MALLQISEPGQSTAPHQHRLAAGIDLGTTNSLVATVRSGSADTLSDEEGKHLLPSVVRYRADGSVEVGAAAKAGAASDPLSTVSSVKRLMGRGVGDVQRLGATLPYDFVASESIALSRETGADDEDRARGGSHHPIGDDIGRVKIPRWLRQYVGGRLDFTHVQGHDFPEDVSGYKLVIHCGACMWNRREVLTRLLHCRRLGRDHRFHFPAGTEEHRPALVDQQPHRAFALLAKQLDMRLSRSRGDAPVHIARIITRLIDAGFIELHATSAKSRQMSTAASRQHLAARGHVQALGLITHGDQFAEVDPRAIRDGASFLNLIAHNDFGAPCDQRCLMGPEPGSGVRR